MRWSAAVPAQEDVVCEVQLGILPAGSAAATSSRTEAVEAVLCVVWDSERGLSEERRWKDSLKADSAWIFTLSLDLLGGRAGSFCHCSVILFVVDSYWVDSSLNHLQLWGAAAGRAQALDMGVGSCWMPHGLVPVSARLV